MRSSSPNMPTLTFGSAWRVIASPAARITSALAAGRSVDDAAVEACSRRKAPRASTATRPMPVIVSARPTLNATISSSPKRDAVQGDRREQDDERGGARKQSAGDADSEERARG